MGNVGWKGRTPEKLAGKTVRVQVNLTPTGATQPRVYALRLGH